MAEPRLPWTESPIPPHGYYATVEGDEVRNGEARVMPEREEDDLWVLSLHLVFSVPEVFVRDEDILEWASKVIRAAGDAARDTS